METAQISQDEICFNSLARNKQAAACGIAGDEEVCRVCVIYSNGHVETVDPRDQCSMELRTNRSGGDPALS